MLRRITPATIHPPFANYCHATLVPSSPRWLYISGQLGIDQTARSRSASSIRPKPASTVSPRSWPRPACGRPIWCASTPTSLDPADLATYMKVRDRYVGDPPPASTLLVVQALARPQFKVEVEATAAAY